MPVISVVIISRSPLLEWPHKGGSKLESIVFYLHSLSYHRQSKNDVNCLSLFLLKNIAWDLFTIHFIINYRRLVNSLNIF